MRLLGTATGSRLGLVACALSLGMLTYIAPASAGSARSNGWLRLAHFSPNTPPVDVYLYSFGNPAARVVLHHVSYGTVSPYLAVPPGTYTVAMRNAGARKNSAPVLSTAVRVRAGNAYTVAGMGQLDGLRLQILSDSLTARPGTAMVRLIQASMRQHLISIRAGGQVLARKLAFATATTYRAVAGGTYTVRASGVAEHVSRAIALSAGTIHTLVVLDVPGHLRIVDLIDAAGSGRKPIGAPATGFGGAAPTRAPSITGWLLAALTGLLITLVGLVGLRRSRSPAVPMR